MSRLFALLLLSVSLFADTVQIDCGSATADQFFSGGATFDSVIPGATGDITVRYGNAFRYHIPQPTGVYLVTLNFRETGTVTTINQRFFSVKVNSQLVLDRFDLFAVAGLEPRERNYVTASNDGFIDIEFYTAPGAAKGAIVSSIAVQQLFTTQAPPPPPPASSTFPVVAEWAKCQSGVVLAGPISPGVPPGSMWPGLKKVSEIPLNPSGLPAPGFYSEYSCDGSLNYYRFKLADGSISGPYVAVRMPDDYAPDPAIWVKQ